MRLAVIMPASRTLLPCALGFAFLVCPAPASLAQNTSTPERGSATEAAAKKEFWLVTRDGQRIASQGPWEVRGRRIVYTSPSGALVSVRLDEIDLEASERASQPPTPPKSEPRAPADPVLVLRSNEQPELAAAAPTSAPDSGSAGESEPADDATGDPRGERSSANATDEVGDAATATDRPARATARRTSAVEVTTWRNIAPEFDSATIYGTLENKSSVRASNIQVMVIVLDEAGGELTRRPARALATQLAPGESTNFQAVLNDLGAHNDFAFEVRASN